MRLILFMAAALATGAISASEVAAHKARMDAAQDAQDALTDAIDAKSVAGANQAAGSLVDILNLEPAYWTRAGAPAAKALADQALDEAENLRTAAGSGAFEQVAADQTRLNQTCRSCHDQHFETLIKIAP